MDFYNTPVYEMDYEEWTEAIVEALKMASNTWVLREIYRTIINITK